MIRNVSEEEALQLQFIENLQREQVPVMEQASRIKDLLETRQVSLESAANPHREVYLFCAPFTLN